MKPSSLSQHARMRLVERTQMREAVLLPLLDYNLVEPLAYHPSVRVWHRLFYSPGDEHHFVAMQAVPSAEVITILPMEFYLQQGYEIGRRKLDLATGRMVKGRISHALTMDPWAVPQLRGRPFQLHGVFRDARQRTRRVWLGMHRCACWPTSAEEAMGEPGLLAYVVKQAEPIEGEGWALATLEMYNPATRAIFRMEWREQQLWNIVLP